MSLIVLAIVVFGLDYVEGCLAYTTPCSYGLIWNAVLMTSNGYNNRPTQTPLTHP